MKNVNLLKTYFDLVATADVFVGFVRSAALPLRFADPVLTVRLAEPVLTLVAGALAPVMPIPVTLEDAVVDVFAVVVFFIYIFDCNFEIKNSI